MLGDTWYCSYRCLAPAVEQRVQHLLFAESPRTSNPPRTPLGLMLVSRGIISSEQLRTITSEGQSTGIELGALLAARGLVTDKQLAAARSDQWGYPIFSVPSHGAPATFRLPSAIGRIFSLVPLHYVPSTNKLLVGFVNAIEYGPLYAIEQLTGCKTQPCFVTQSDFSAQIQAATPEAEASEMLFDTVQPASEMTRTLCSQGIIWNADQISIARCKGYVWARLKSGANPLDIVFRVATLSAVSSNPMPA